MIKEFTKYLEAQVTSLSMSVASRNLYAGRRPQSAPDVSTVVEEPFPDPTDDQLLDKVEKTFRIECRGSKDNYFSAHDVAAAIHTALHGNHQVTLTVVGSGPTYLCNIRCTEPASLGPEAETRRPRVYMYIYCNTQEI